MPQQTDPLLERWTEYESAHARLHLPDGSTLEAGPVAGTQNRGAFPDAAGRTICVITADNPGGDVADEINYAAHRALLERAEELGWDYLPAHGGDPAWTHVEACIAVFGATVDEVCSVGREFGQDAIFVWTPQRWSLVMCDHSMQTDFAWQSWIVTDHEPGPRTARPV